jgi:hypothetical protein
MPVKVHPTHLKIVGISALVLLSVAAIVAFGGHVRESSPDQGEGLASQAPVAAFTLTTSRKLVPTGGRERLLSTQQRFQRSDGTYKLVQTAFAPDGSVATTQTLFGFVGIGVFRLDEGNKRLVFAGPQSDDRPADVAKFLRTHELFVREEAVSGINTIVWRQPGRTKANFIEEYRAPSLSGMLIKTVMVSDRGRETVEPTAIKMGEPALGLFAELWSCTADYSSYEREVQEKAKTEPEIALLLQQALTRVRQTKP